MQKTFIAAIAEGLPQVDAARRAGYSDPSYTAWDLLRLPHVRQAIQERRERAFTGDIGTLCMDALKYCLVHGKPDVRLKAAVYGLEVGGIARKTNPSLSTGKPDLLAMSEQELLAFVRRNEEQLLVLEAGTVKDLPNTSEIDEILS